MQSALSVTLGLSSRAPITVFDEAYLGMDAPTRDIFYTFPLDYWRISMYRLIVYPLYPKMVYYNGIRTTCSTSIEYK